MLRLVSVMVLTIGCLLAIIYLNPHQIAQIMSTGTEVPVHAFRSILHAHLCNPGKLAIKADAENSFKSALRAAFSAGSSCATHEFMQVSRHSCRTRSMRLSRTLSPATFYCDLQKSLSKMIS